MRTGIKGKERIGRVTVNVGDDNLVLPAPKEERSGESHVLRSCRGRILETYVSGRSGQGAGRMATFGWTTKEILLAPGLSFIRS